MLDRIENTIEKIDQSKYASLIYIFISSVLTSLSFYPWSLWPIGFVCLWPFIHHLETTTFKRRAVLKIVGLGFLQGILISIFSFHWVTHTMVVFGHIPWPVAISIFLLYGAGTNLRWVIFFLAVYYFNQFKKGHLAPETTLSKILLNPYLVMTGFWGISEYLGWQLFPYYGLNLASSNLIFVQMADMIGTYGGSLVWFLIGYSFYLGIKNRKLPKLGFALFILCHLYGSIAFWYWSNEQKNYSQFHIGVVQGNTPLGFRAGRTITSLADEYIDKMINLSYKIVREAEQQNKPLDLIIWPESSVPFVGYFFYEKLREGLAEFQEHHKISFLINDLLILRNYDPKQRQNYNNVFLLNEDGKIVESYQKVKLLPFGEFIPLGDVFPSLKKTFAEISGFTHGKKFTTLPSKIGNIMPLICYEVIVPDFVYEFDKVTRNKTQIFVNVTNDSWFGNSIESAQHMELGRMRSIEFRLPMVRGVNGGVSTWLDVTGRNYDATKVLTQANKIYTVPVPKRQKTIYASYGYYFYYIFLIFFSISFLLGILKHFANKK